MDSLDAKLESLTASAEKLYMQLFDSDSFKSLIETVATLVDGISSFVEGLGGGGNLLLMLTPLLTNLFSKTIGQGLSSTLINLVNAKTRAQEMSASLIEMRSLLKDIGDGTEIDPLSVKFLKI